MIHGIGTDIVAIKRFNTIYSKYPQKCHKKILSPIELTQFNKIKLLEKQIKFIATRWAVKEAFVKAIGIGFRNGLYLPQISIIKNTYGQPKIILSSLANNTLQKKFIDQKFNFHISLSDDSDYAIAYCIVEKL